MSDAKRRRLTELATQSLRFREQLAELQAHYRRIRDQTPEHDLDVLLDYIEMLQVRIEVNSETIDRLLDEI